MDVPVEGIDQIRTREDFARALNQFRACHAAKHQQPELSYGKIGEKAGYRRSSIHNYLKAKTLPQRREIVMDILDVFDASPAEVEAMLRAYDRLKEAPRPAAQETKGPPPQPRHTRRSMLIGGLRVVTVGALIALTSTATLAGGSEERQSPPPDWLTLEDLPPARYNPAVPATTCEAKLTHVHPFDDGFVGSVWVHFAPAQVTTGSTTVSLKWGSNLWTEYLPLAPGAVTAGQGGTLVLFRKHDVESPAVIFRSSVPVCAVFGTDRTRPLPAPTEKLEAQGWIKI